MLCIAQSLVIVGISYLVDMSCHAQPAVIMDLNAAAGGLSGSTLVQAAVA